MKKFTLFLLSAFLMTAVGMAQPSATQRPLSTSRVAALTKNSKDSKETGMSKASMQKQVDMKRLHAKRAALSKKLDKVGKSLETKGLEQGEPAVIRAPKKAISGDESYITEQPEGRHQFYTRSGWAYYVYIIYVTNSEYSGAVGNVVFGENNEIYIKNIISQLPTDSWVKGQIDGSKIVIDFPQKALVMEGGPDIDGEEYNVEMVTYDADEQWYVPAKKQTLTLNYNANNGTISCPAGSAIATGESIIGLVDVNEEWAGYGDWAFTMKEMNDTPVTAPEGLETSDYAVTADDFGGTIAQVGFQGNDVYVQGLYPGMPEAWVKGTIEGNKATFKNGQFMGADESTGYYQYLVSGTVVEKYDDYFEIYYTEYELADGDVTFDYDAATKTFSNSSCFLVNAGTEDVSYAAAYNNATLLPFEEVAATPATPVWDGISEGGFEYYSYGYGWGYLSFNIPTADVDGNFILPEKLSFQIYTRVNGEEKPLTLSANNYVYFDEDMDEVPFGYSDGWDVAFSGNNADLYYYVIGPEAFGVQSIYRGAGEEHRSEIVWCEVEGLGAEVQPDAATPDYPDVDPSDIGSSIGFGFYTGNEDVYSFGEFYEDSYDVAIHLQDETLVGTHIESITIPLMETKGVSGVKAWLTSQLRVENGKNVPDLVSVDVTDAKPGFVTVNLEKPYVIPEDGVYVGYSLTVDDASKEVNMEPIAVIDQQNEGGFYLHTGNEFLKWFDLSADFAVSACIQVTVSGSKVSNNAAGTADGDNLYVTTGEPFEVSVPITNHGAKGIQSLDIDYSMSNGTNGTQHFDLDPAVEGFFGKFTTVTLNMPAIAERGTYDLQMTVAKVNGEVNSDATKTGNTKVVALNALPKKRTVMEEYTGTWCGWCPRGFVALEKLADLYEGDYVLLSYHYSDPMEALTFFPSEVEGYPDAWLDRAEEVDPYYGTDYGEDFFVAKDMARRNKLFAHASVEFESKMSEDGEAVNVSTQVVFPFDMDEADYTLEYLLVADGLTGGSAWDQANNYSGGYDGGYLEEFNNAGSKVSGLVFNDVVIMSEAPGYGIAESIPTSFKADQPIEHSHSFLLANAVSTSGESLVQPQAVLKVAVLLINAETGEIVNANIAPVGTTTNGIESVKGNGSDIVSVRYFDLGGRQMPSLQRGVNIVKMTFSDGTQKTIKMTR